MQVYLSNKSHHLGHVKKHIVSLIMWVNHIQSADDLWLHYNFFQPVLFLRNILHCCIIDYKNIPFSCLWHVWHWCCDLLERLWTPVRSVINKRSCCCVNIINAYKIRIAGIEKKLLLILSLIGFVFHDGVYVAAVMNHAIQSELNISFLRSLCEKVKNRKYDNFDVAIKVCI